MAFDPSSARLSRIMKYINMLWSDGKVKYPDLKIKLGDKDFHAHKIMLICHSDYLCDKIINDPTITELTIPPEFGITQEAFNDAMVFMYKSELALTPEKLESLQNLAKKLGMYHIAKLCETLSVPAINAIPDAAILGGGDELKKLGGGGALMPPMVNAMPWGSEDYVSGDKMWQPSLRPSAITHYMKYLWFKKLEDSADFVVNVSGQDFKVHKFILACHSYFFAELFKKTAPGLTSWNVPQFLCIDPSAFQELLKIMYTQDIDSPELNANLIGRIKQAADAFKMSHLSKALDEKYPDIPRSGGQGQGQLTNMGMMMANPAPQLMGGFNPTFQPQFQAVPAPLPPTFPGQFQTGMTFGPTPPTMPMMQMMPLPPPPPQPMVYPTVMSQPFPYLPPPPPPPPLPPPQYNTAMINPSTQQNINELLKYLSSDSINLSNEMDVFNYALNWLKRQPNPNPMVFKVMSCIRFYLLSRPQIQQIVGLTRDWFTGNAEYRDLILTADWLLGCQRYNLDPMFTGNPRSRAYMRA